MHRAGDVTPIYAKGLPIYSEKIKDSYYLNQLLTTRAGDADTGRKLRLQKNK